MKVQRPGVPEVLALDAHLLRMLGGQMQKFAGTRSDLVAVVDEMVKSLTVYVEFDVLWGSLQALKLVFCVK